MYHEHVSYTHLLTFRWYSIQFWSQFDKLALYKLDYYYSGESQNWTGESMKPVMSSVWFTDEVMASQLANQLTLTYTVLFPFHQPNFHVPRALRSVKSAHKRILKMETVGAISVKVLKLKINWRRSHKTSAGQTEHTVHLPRVSVFHNFSDGISVVNSHWNMTDGCDILHTVTAVKSGACKH